MIIARCGGALALMGIATLFVLAMTMPSHAQEPSLEVKVIAAPASVDNGHNFVVKAQIVNTGKETTPIGVWNCSYDLQWKTDSAYVQVAPTSCRANSVNVIVLGPGVGHEEEVHMHLLIPSDKLGMESVAFRLGFQTADESAKVNALAPFVWSEPVTLKIGGQGAVTPQY